MKRKVFAVLVALFVIAGLTSCISTTTVTFISNAEDAEVYVDGSYVGKTPVTTQLSNAVWEDPSIIVKKDGYKTEHTYLRKRVVGGNIAIGLFLNQFAFLWCYGPAKVQYVDLIEE